MSDAFKLELLKGGISILTPVLAAMLLYVVGRYLTDRYSEQKRQAELCFLRKSQVAQKQRELQLAAAARFYELYGEFFAVWKQWSAAKSGNVAPGQPLSYRQDLYQRACAAEGGMEAIFVRLATEFVLGPSEVETIGRFRQAYQSIRQAIREDRDLGWGDSSHPQYVALKQRARAIASMLIRDEFHMLTRDEFQKLPSAEEAATALLDVTDNKWERDWDN